MNNVKYEWYESLWFIIIMFLLWPFVIPLIIGIAMLHKRNAKTAQHNHDQMMMQAAQKANSIPRQDIIFSSSTKLERQQLSDMPEIKFKNITKSTNLSAMPAFVVIDTETTGLSASTDRIIELSAIIYEDFKPVKSFSTLVNPGRHIPERASAVNNIYDNDVATAPPLDYVADSFTKFIKNLPVVGYNVAFDLKFLYCSGIDIMDDRKFYDAYALSRKAFKGLDSYSLQNVASALGIVYNAHRSLDDCYATGDVFKAAALTITR